MLIDIQDAVDTMTRSAVIFFRKQLAALPTQDFMQAVLSGPSDGHSHDWSWIGDLAAVNEWTDERTLNELQQFSYSLTNARWESTVRVPLMAFRTQNATLIQQRVNELVEAGRRHLWRRFIDLLIAGTTGLGFDAAAFFADAHSYADSGSYDNLLGGSGVDTDAHVETDWLAVKAAMASFPNSRGEPIEAVPDLVVCPTGVEHRFRKLFNATMLSNNSNIYVNEAQVIGSARLAANDANDWYAFCTKLPAKPFVFQENIPWRMGAVTNLNDSWVFLNDALLYGGDGYYQMGYGLPQLAVKVVNS